MLLPISISVYTAAGGLRATFVAAYTHNVVVFATILCMVFIVSGGCCGLLGVFRWSCIEPATKTTYALGAVGLRLVVALQW